MWRFGVEFEDFGEVLELTHPYTCPCSVIHIHVPNHVELSEILTCRGVTYVCFNFRIFTLIQKRRKDKWSSQNIHTHKRKKKEKVFHGGRLSEAILLINIILWKPDQRFVGEEDIQAWIILFLVFFWSFDVYFMALWAKLFLLMLRVDEP